MDYINQLKKFRSSEISDALDSLHIEGALLRIKPLVPGLKLVGPAFTLEYVEKESTGSFAHAANYIDNVPKDSVIVINNHYREDCTVWGEILTQTALKKGISGTVIAGAIRDVALIRSLRYPIYHSDVYMRSGKNRVQMIKQQAPIMINNVLIHPNDIVFADDDGVLIIPQALVQEIINKANNIQLTETNIKKAVDAGMTLEQARKEYGYNKPWEKK